MFSHTLARVLLVSQIDSPSPKFTPLVNECQYVGTGQDA